MLVKIHLIQIAVWERTDVRPYIGPRPPDSTTAQLHDRATAPQHKSTTSRTSPLHSSGEEAIPWMRLWVGPMKITDQRRIGFSGQELFDDRFIFLRFRRTS